MQYPLPRSDFANYSSVYYLPQYIHGHKPSQQVTLENNEGFKTRKGFNFWHLLFCVQQQRHMIVLNYNRSIGTTD